MNVSRIGRDGIDADDLGQPDRSTAHDPDPSTTRSLRSNPRRRMLSVPELDQIPELSWLVDDLIAEESLVVLFGPTGSYKTFVSVALALSVSTGAAFAGRHTKKGPVVYVCAEGQRGIKWRIRAWLQACQRRDPRLWVVPAAVAFDDQDQVGEFLYDLRSLPEAPSLVVVDTLARTFGEGDESSSRDMNIYLAAAERLIAELGTTVLVIHHSGKKDRADPRGSGALIAAADTVLCLESNSRLRAAMAVTKQRETDEGREFEVILDEVNLEADAKQRANRSLVARLAETTRKGRG